MTFVYLFHLEPNLYDVMMKKLTTGEDITLAKFEWADWSAEERHDSGV